MQRKKVSVLQLATTPTWYITSGIPDGHFCAIPSHATGISPLTLSLKTAAVHVEPEACQGQKVPRGKILLYAKGPTLFVR